MKHLVDMLNRIKVSCLARNLNVKVTKTKLCLKVLNILLDYGYINGFTYASESEILVLLKYPNSIPIMLDLFVVSTPTRQVYMSYRSILKYKRNQFLLISTKLGVLERSEVLKRKVGGVVLFSIR